MTKQYRRLLTIKNSDLLRKINDFCFEDQIVAFEHLSAEDIKALIQMEKATGYSYAVKYCARLENVMNDDDIYFVYLLAPLLDQPKIVRIKANTIEEARKEYDFKHYEDIIGDFPDSDVIFDWWQERF